MKLENRTASLLVTEDGRKILQAAAIRCDADSMLRAEVAEAEDLGLWLRIFRDEREHYFLLRWEYIFGVDVEAPLERPFGLSRGKGLG